MLPGIIISFINMLVFSLVLFFIAISPQATVLDFASDVQWVQYGEGGERVEFVANRTREGTFPPGSQWSRNPIPACIEPDGGYMQVLIF